MPALPLWWCLKIARRAPVSLQEVSVNGRASASEDQISCGLPKGSLPTAGAYIYTIEHLSQPSASSNPPPPRAHPTWTNWLGFG